MISFEQARAIAETKASVIDMYIEQDDAWLFRDGYKSGGIVGSPYFAVMKDDGSVFVYSAYRIHLHGDDEDFAPLNNKPTLL